MSAVLLNALNKDISEMDDFEKELIEDSDIDEFDTAEAEDDLVPTLPFKMPQTPLAGAGTSPLKNDPQFKIER